MDGKALEQRVIEVPQPRVSELIAATGPERAERIHAKGSRVEPTLQLDVLLQTSGKAFLFGKHVVDSDGQKCERVLAGAIGRDLPDEIGVDVGRREFGRPARQRRCSQWRAFGTLSSAAPGHRAAGGDQEELSPSRAVLKPR